MRPQGARNQNYEKKRKSLLVKLHKVVADKGIRAGTMRELAKGARTSLNTLQHYFGTQDELLRNIFEEIQEQGKPYMAGALQLAQLPPHAAIETLLVQVFQGWRPGALQSIHEFGIYAGLESTTLGPAYINHLLEPTLQTVEHLFLKLEETGKIEVIEDKRTASLALLCPLIMALLHQNSLGGKNCRALDIPKMISTHTEHFLRGWVRSRP